MRFSCWIAVCAGLFAFPPAFAAPVPWEITADSLIRYQDPEGIFAEGNVVLRRPPEAGGPLLIKADWVRYDVGQGLIKARGNVTISSPTEEVTAVSALLDINTQTGRLDQAEIFLAENHLYIRGTEVEKTGPETYVVTDGWTSACRPGRDGSLPAWSIRSGKARLTLDGMAHLTHARFQVKEVPVLYTPYILFPAKTKRETGFLFPEWSHSSRSGLGLTAPFFVNLSPSADITLYPSYLSERGLMSGGEFRYMLGERSQGTFLVSYLRDRLTDDDQDDYKNDNLLRTTRDRYWIRGKADHDFGDGLVGHLDLDLVSDQDFYQEFNTGSLGYDASNLEFSKVFGRDLAEETQTTRESALQLVKGWRQMTATGEIRVRQEVAGDIVLGSSDRDGLLEPGEFSFRSNPDSPLQALPRLTWNGRIPLAGNPWSVGWDTEYVNYWRDRGVGAHRLDLHPQLIRSLPKNPWVEGKTTLGVRETLYQVESYDDAAWNFDRFQDRTGIDFEGNVATLLMREFDLSEGDFLVHTVRPNLVYSYASRTSEAKLPSLDGVDRVAIKNWLTYELTNYLDLEGSDGEGNFLSRHLGYLKILQTYNIREARRETAGSGDRKREFSDLRFDLVTQPLAGMTLRYQTNLSPYGLGITRNELLAGYSTRSGHSVSLDYRYLRYGSMAEPYFYTTSGETLHDMEATGSFRLTHELTMRASVNKSFATNHTVERVFGLTYKLQCWMLEAETRRSTDGEESIMVIFTLEGIGRAFRWGKDV